jgi:hypothetical protein
VIVFVVDAAEAVGDARALDQRLMAQEALRVGLPRPGLVLVPVAVGAQRPVNLIEVLAHDDRVRAVLPVDDDLHPLGARPRVREHRTAVSVDSLNSKPSDCGWSLMMRDQPSTPTTGTMPFCLSGKAKISG